MSTKHSSAEKRTDRTDLTDTELAALKDRAGTAISGRDLLGIDADGRIHFFSMVTREIAVFEDVADTDPKAADLRDLDLDDHEPVDWAARVAIERGKWQELRLSQRASELFEVDY